MFLGLKNGFFRFAYFPISESRIFQSEQFGIFFGKLLKVSRAIKSWKIGGNNQFASSFLQEISNNKYFRQSCILIICTFTI